MNLIYLIQRHRYVYNFLRIKIFQLHITDMKMNLKSCLSEVDQCTLSPRKIQTLRYSLQHLLHGALGIWENHPRRTYKKEIHDEYF